MASEKFEYFLHKTYGMGIKDRTGNIDLKISTAYKNIPATPLPTVKTTEKVFSDICAERVEEIKQQTQNSNTDICILWSGGIDSTAVLYSFLEAENVSFKVACNEDSKEEYPSVYTDLVNGNFSDSGVTEVLNSTAYSASYLNDNYSVVTGEFGDQICGTVAHFISNDSNLSLRENLLSPWRDQVVDGIITDDVEASLSECPFEIVDMADFLWWWNFTCKWHAVDNRLLHAVFGLIPNHFELDTKKKWNGSHFFSSDSFQQWAMSNREPNKEFLVSGNKSHNKKLIKDYIYSINGDSDYLFTKTKQPSLDGESVFRKNNAHDINF